MWNPRAVFAAYIPFYAPCTTTFIGDTDVSPVPIRHSMGLRTITFRWRRAGPISKGCAVLDAMFNNRVSRHVSFYDNPLGNKTPEWA